MCIVLANTMIGVINAVHVFVKIIKFLYQSIASITKYSRINFMLVYFLGHFTTNLTVFPCDQPTVESYIITNKVLICVINFSADLFSNLYICTVNGLLTDRLIIAFYHPIFPMLFIAQF